MGSREERIAQHVNAVEILIGRNVIAVVVQANDGEISLVTPSTTAVETMRALASLDWKRTYASVVEQEERG